MGGRGARAGRAASRRGGILVGGGRARRRSGSTPPSLRAGSALPRPPRRPLSPGATCRGRGDSAVGCGAQVGRLTAGRRGFPRSPTARQKVLSGQVRWKHVCCVAASETRRATLPRATRRGLLSLTVRERRWGRPAGQAVGEFCLSRTPRRPAPFKALKRTHARETFDDGPGQHLRPAEPGGDSSPHFWCLGTAARGEAKTGSFPARPADP